MTTQTLVLQGESELRLEVDFDKIVVVTVKEGIAEVLGLELAQGKEYAFAGAKVAIYTWFGARVEVVGAAGIPVELQRPAGELVELERTHVHLVQLQLTHSKK